MNEVKFSLELANMILAYLGKRPYEEVFSIVQKMQDEHKAHMDATLNQNLTEEQKESES